MKKHGVTHVVYLPDSETNWLYLLMKADPAMRLVGVGREGNACSIAAGLWLGGRNRWSDPEHRDARSRGIRSAAG